MRRSHGLLATGVLAAAVLTSGSSLANDRPFQVARTALMEDDEQVWSFETWVERRGAVRGLSVELKQIFNHIGRDGYGVALTAAFGVERTREAGTVRGLALKLPVSVALGETGATLHLNPGWSRATPNSGRSPGRWTSAWAIDDALPRRTSALLEWAHDGGTRFAELGARHWLRKERLAIDLSWQRFSSAEGRASGLLVGVGWYDL